MSEETLAQTIVIVSAYVANHNIRPDDVPSFIASTHAAVVGLDAPVPAEVVESATEEYVPAVTARKSLANPDFIISLIDGKAYKTLRRHLSTNGLTPQEYRQRYKLKSDYPMVAPSYSETRRSLANKIGLGRKAAGVAGAVVEGAKSIVGADAKPTKPAKKKLGITSAARADGAPAKPRARKAPTEQQQADLPPTDQEQSGLIQAQDVDVARDEQSPK